MQPISVFPPLKSLGYATLKGVQPHLPPMFLSSTYGITGLQYTNGCATISAANVSKLLPNHYWVTPYLWRRHLKFSLYLLALPTE